MTQKELNYMEDAVGHEKSIIKILEESINNLDDERFINFMKDNDILSVFHYIPLHISPAGKKYGEFHGEDKYTTRESERLVRLPLYYSLDDATQGYIIEQVKRFFGYNY